MLRISENKRLLKVSISLCLGFVFFVANSSPAKAVDGLFNGKFLTGETDDFVLWLQSYDQNTSPYYNDLFFLNKVGNVGIGTTAPGAKLDIVGALRTTSATISLLGNSGNRIVMTDDSGNLYATSSSVASGLPAPIAGNKNFTLRSDGTNWIANSLIYNDGTNVGIGTTNPVAKLNVAGTLYQTGGSGIITSKLDSSWLNATQSLTISSGASASVIMNPFGGNVGIGAASAGAMLDITKSLVLGSTQNMLSFKHDSSYNLRLVQNFSAAGNMQYDWIQGEGGVDKNVMTFQHSNVGVNTTSPAYKLDVVGEASFNTNQVHGISAPTQLTDAANRGYVDTAFANLASSTNALNYWTANGNSIFNNNTANVGIGTTNPLYKLDVRGSAYVASMYVETPPGPWLSGKTGTSGLNGATQQTVSAYHPMLRQKTSDGHVINLGGLGNAFGFYGYDAARTENGYDYSFVMNLANGAVTASNNFIVNGNISVGTAASAYKLNVLGDANFLSNQIHGVSAPTQLTDVANKSYVDTNTFWSGSLTGNAYNINSGNIGIGTTNPGAKLQINGDLRINMDNNYVNRKITTISRAIATGAGSWVNLGSVISNGQGTYVTVYQSNHHSSTVNSAVYEILDVYFAGATLDWMQVPTTNYRSYTGTQDYSIDVRRTANHSAANLEIRARALNATPGTGTLQFEIQTNGTFVADSTAGTGATVSGYLSRNAYQFPVSNNRFAASTDGIFILNTGNVGIGTTTPNAKLTVSGGNIFVTDAQITSLTPNAVITKAYLDSSLTSSGASLWATSTAGTYNVGLGKVGIGTTNPGGKLTLSAGQSVIERGNTDNGLFGTSKLNSQGIAWSTDSGAPSIILQGGALDKPEISWYRGARTYPEFSIRKHDSSDTGATFWVGNGQVSPSAAMSIINGGNVGIGTTTPGSLLTLGNAFALTSGGTMYSGATTTRYVDLSGVMPNGLSVSNDIYSSAGSLKIAGTDKNYIMGNVGIGVTNPTVKLHVGSDIINSSAKATDDLVISRNLVNGWHGLYIGENDFNVGGVMQSYYKYSAPYYSILSLGTRGWGGDEHTLNLKDGNVGVGTINPSNKLTIQSGVDDLIPTLGNNGGKLALLNNGSYGLLQGVIGNGSAFIQAQRVDSVASVYSLLLQPNGGNVGIGTTTPGAKLTVSGGNIFVTDAQITSATPHAVITKGYLDAIVYPSSTPSVGTQSGFWTAGASNSVYNNNTGNIGIGTTNPGAKLEVNGDLFINKDGLAQMIGTGAYSNVYTMYRSTQGGYIGLDATNDAFRIQGGADRKLILGTNNSVFGSSSNSLVINEDGNIGIGTTNPQVKLDVSGVVSAVNNTYGDNNGALILGGQAPNIIQRLQRDGGGYGFSIFKAFADNTTNGLSSKILDYGAYGDLKSGAIEPTIEYAYFGVGPSATLYNTHIRLYNNLNKVVSFDGNVGINTTSPGYKLDVAGEGKFLGQVHGVSTPTQLTDVANRAYVDTNTFWSGTLTGNISNLNAGNAGIGTTNPLGKVGISQNMSSYSTAFTSPHLALTAGNNVDTTGFVGITYGASSSPNYGWSSGALRSTNGQSDFVWKYHNNTAAGVEIMRLSGAGVLSGVSLTGTVSAANVSNGKFGDNTAGGIYSFPGNVGIGITNPGGRLDVNGGALRLSSGAYLDINRSSSSASGISWYSQTYNAWADYMASPGANMGPKGNLTAPSGVLVNGWALRSFIENANGFGWTFESELNSSTAPKVKFEIRSNDGSFHSYGDGFIDGAVGIGTTAPGLFKLKVVGNAAITGTLQTMTGSDFAEEFTVSYPIEAGTVVVMGDLGYKSVKACSQKYDTTVVGIVSDDPSIIAGKVDSKHKAVVAMMGVVKVKVTDVNGKIKKGTLLTTSSIPGYAMKSSDYTPGTMIGKALEDLSGSRGEIKVLVNLQ